MSEAPVAAIGAALGAALEGVLEGVSLRLGGRQVLARPQDCAMVFQAPRLLLMDEPFAALDAITRRSLQAALRQLIATRQTTCLFVTHDVDEALALGRRLFVMQAGRVARQWNAPWRADEARSQIVQALRAADASFALSDSAAAPVSPVSFP